MIGSSTRWQALRLERMLIEGALHRYSATIEDMEVLFGGLQALVTEYLLYPSRIDS